MAKRFTDSGKWRNEWFRTLPLKAKLAWAYVCDECDHAGVWKADYGLASFQLDFKLSPTDLKIWFGSKMHFFGTDKVLIVPFFEFQYGESKDTWTAKIKARERIESLGFQILNNKIQIPQSGDSGGSVQDSTPLVLNVVVGEGVVKGINKRGNEKFEFAAAEYLKLPNVTLGPKAEARFIEQIKSDFDQEQLLFAITNYRQFLAMPGNSWRRPKTTFETFLGTATSGFFWRDYINWKPPEAMQEIPLNEDYFDKEVSS